jgi:hypothetical protein
MTHLGIPGSGDAGRGTDHTATVSVRAHPDAAHIFWCEI